MKSNFVAFIFLIILSSFTFKASQSSVEIAWKSNRSEMVNGSYKQVLYFDDAHYFENLNGLPSIIVKDISQPFTISNAKVLKLTDAELLLIDTTLISQDFAISQHHWTLHKKPVTTYSILPFRKNISKNYFEKLVSFQVKFDEKSAVSTKALRIKPSKENWASSSVLASGDWYKLAINGSTTDDGSRIYKLDYNYLQKIGFPVNSVNPKNIQIFGNGMGMLPLANSTARPDDLVENAIKVVGEEDGKFDANDYILFYAQGPHEWKYSSANQDFDFVKNLYSEQSFYYLTSNAAQMGKRIGTQSNNYIVDDNTEIVTTTMAHQVYERDEFNLLESGNRWFSNAVESPFNVQFNIQGLVLNSVVSLEATSMAQATVPTKFEYTSNGQLFNQNISAYSFRDQWEDKGRASFNLYNINNAVEPVLNIGVSYSKQGNFLAKGFLDYLKIHYTKSLGLYGSQTAFYTNGYNKAGIQKIKINVSNPTSTSIWNVNNVTNVMQVATSNDITNLYFNDSVATINKYIVHAGTSFDSPVFAGKVVNQNLHAIVNGSIPDMVIITVPSFYGAANTLKAHRSQRNNMDVLIVSTEQIYNEFSSGKQDLTAIRDFLRMLYVRSNDADSLKYVLLLGGASFDYKDRIESNHNFIPIFESTESLHIVRSYSSDDYIVLLDEEEGDWEQNTGRFVSVDVGLGRLPVRNAVEAAGVVQKIIDYETSPNSLGKWRNKVTFLADDASGSESGNPHLFDAERSISALQSVDQNMNIDKLYIDAFPQVSSPSGEVCPLIKQSLMRNIYQGTLIVNYSGHGGEFILAQEDIININDINTLENKYRLPFFITATCEFGRYEDPKKFSGGLSLILNPNGGAIGLLCSTRPVYSSTNTLLNTNFYLNQFPKAVKNRNYPTLGEVTMRTKNTSYAGINNRNYALLGDPSMTLAIPKDEVVITKINDKDALDNFADTLKALSLVTIEGEIKSQNSIQSNFSGRVSLSLYDKVQDKITLGANPSSPTKYQIRNSLVYDGTVKVDSGKFQFQFVISKDINYDIGSSKLSFYASSIDGRDAGNADTTIKLGGSNDNIVADNTPPEIKLFVNDTTFVNGGYTGNEPKLIAQLFDENGINISSSGIGHQITGRLNNERNTIVMNDFYTTRNNSYKYGIVEYPISKLEEGKYTLTFKAWDTHNNSSEQSIDFIVADNERFAIRQIMNFPNPFSEKTSFSFDHNRAGENLDITIDITNELGMLVKTIRKQVDNSPTMIKDIDWDGATESGVKLPTGTYIYNIKITSVKDNAVVQEIKRLVLLN